MLETLLNLFELFESFGFEFESSLGASVEHHLVVQFGLDLLGVQVVLPLGRSACKFVVELHPQVVFAVGQSAASSLEYLALLALLIAADLGFGELVNDFLNCKLLGFSLGEPLLNRVALWIGTLLDFDVEGYRNHLRISWFSELFGSLLDQEELVTPVGGGLSDLGVQLLELGLKSRFVFDVELVDAAHDLLVVGVSLGFLRLQLLLARKLRGVKLSVNADSVEGLQLLLLVSFVADFPDPDSHVLGLGVLLCLEFHPSEGGF